MYDRLVMGTSYLCTERNAAHHAARDFKYDKYILKALLNMI